MEYTHLLKDFSRRTIANLRFLEAGQGTAVDQAPFIVTARLGTFLSIIVLIQNDIQNIQRNHHDALEALAESLAPMLISGFGFGARDQVTAFRNAVGHGHLVVEADEDRKIGRIRFQHERGTWEAQMTPEQLAVAVGHLEAFISAI